MSLINDMLRNLEANRPDDLAGHNLQREIRSLPPAAPPRQGRRLALLILLLLAVSTAAWQWQDRPEELPITVQPLSPPVLVAPSVAAPNAVPAAQHLVLAQELLSLQPGEAALPAAPAVPAAVSVPPVVAATPTLVTPAPMPAPASPLQHTEAVKIEAPVASPAPVKIEKSPVLTTARDRADAEWRRAEAAFAGGRGEEGREALRAALRLDPGHVQLRQALLRHLLEARKIDDAVAVLQEGLEQQPTQAGWAMSLARLQLERGDLAAADASLARSQAFAENSADYAGFQGHLKSRLGAHRQAAAHYQRATRLAPNDGRWWLGLGLALEADGRLPEGREALRRALAAGNLPGDLAAVAEQHLR